MNRRQATPYIGWGVALLLIALGCSLGSWQLRRMHEKEAMLASVAAVLHDRLPQPLALAADPARRQTYDWTAGEGHFLPGPPWLLDNQQREGRPGVRVFRLFQPQGAAAPLLVEMGWLPIGGDRALPAIEPPPAGTPILKPAVRRAKTPRPMMNRIATMARMTVIAEESVAVAGVVPSAW